MFMCYMFSENNFGTEPNPYEIRDIHAPYIEEGPFLDTGEPNLEWINNIMTLQEHTFVTGTQWPFWDYTLPPGVALKVSSNFGLDLNPHYFNYTEETIHGEVYINLHVSSPQNVEHVAGILQLGYNNIELPPNQETTITEIFTTNQIINSTNITSANVTNMINTAILIRIAINMALLI